MQLVQLQFGLLHVVVESPQVQLAQVHGSQLQVGLSQVVVCVIGRSSVLLRGLPDADR